MIAQESRYCGFCRAHVAWFCGTDILRCQQQRAQRQAKADPDEHAVLWVDLLWALGLTSVLLGVLALVEVLWR